ncbi:MAG TPA: VanZ family protein [Bryobacteraceae bacterium]|jgi:VanZ family protein
MIPHGALAKRWLRTVWFAAIGVVIVASLLPSNSLPMRALDWLDFSDKFEHALAYFVLALLPALHERRSFVAAAALGAAGLGIALEYGQLYSGWRDFEVGDMIADAIGVCGGVLAGLRLHRSRWMRSLLQDKAEERRDAAATLRR